MSENKNWKEKLNNLSDEVASAVEKAYESYKEYRISGLTKKRNAIKTKILRLQAKKAKIDAKANVLQAKIDELNNKIEQIDQSINNFDKECKSCNNDKNFS